MYRFISTQILAALLMLPLMAIPPANDFSPQPQVVAVSPAEFLKTVELPDGYSLELVLSEPQIKEPVTISFDPNGAMYVAEMRTYMQNIDGADGLTPGSVVSKHVSTKGDGNFDQHSTYLKDVAMAACLSMGKSFSISSNLLDNSSSEFSSLEAGIGMAVLIQL